MFFSRRRVGVCAAALAVALAAPAAQAAGGGLLELINSAEERHAPFLAQQADLRAAQQDEAIVRSELLPQVAASANKTALTEASVPWQARVVATQPLVDFPALMRRRAAGEQTRLAEISLQTARKNLWQTVVDAWLQTQQTREQAELVEARINTLREQAARIEALAEVGRATRAEALLASAALAEAAAQRQQSKHNHAVAVANLQRITGAQTLAARRLQQNIHKQLPPLSPLAHWLKQTAAQNLELAQARQQVAHLRQRLRAAKTAAYPRLAVAAQAQWEENKGGAARSLNFSLSQALFSGGNLTAQERRLLALLEAARQREQDAGRQQRQEARRLHGQLQTDQARLFALLEAANARERALQDMTVAYENGAGVAEDVLRAEENAFDSRLQYRAAAYAYLKNLTALAALAGDLAGEGGGDFINQMEALFEAAQ